MRNPFGKLEHIVHTLAELRAYPLLQTHCPPTNCWLSPQAAHAEPSPEAVDPAGQIVQTPLILPSPGKQPHDYVFEL